jgi:membrane protein DedA with SNARE-associated domain
VTATMAQLVATYGYWAVALAVGLESVGVPMPGETALIAAALFAAPPTGSALPSW